MPHAAADSPVLSRHAVRRHIEQAILCGEFAPGSRLKQMDLARRFGVAQTVVRESLLELRVTGLVEAIDNLGMFVADLSTGKILDAYAIREVLEGLAARTCCELASRTTLRDLESLANEAHELGLAKRFDEMIVLDRRFHQLIIATAGNQLLEQLTRGYRVLGMAVWAQRDVNDVHREHLAIVKAIGDNHPDEAERLARAHARAARESIERMVKSGEFKPHWVVEAEASHNPDDPPRRTRTPRTKD